jgi:hypothetical protein
VGGIRHGADAGNIGKATEQKVLNIRQAPWRKCVLMVLTKILKKYTRF